MKFIIITYITTPTMAYVITILSQNMLSTPPITIGVLLMGLLELALEMAMLLAATSYISLGLLHHGKKKILFCMFTQHLMILEKWM
ncbi:hypothetical protein B6U81_01000 [Thermoplasmatales archaeon ex4484_30]|nr:MAG: hypothetical protein B6U81_01000 [Thermoplasmatales archaeon ex4484_30]